MSCAVCQKLTCNVWRMNCAPKQFLRYQKQVAILALGAIRKRPAVLETPHGDVIAIRHMMFLSHSYDHRVVDGMLGGSFVRRVADYLEGFDPKRPIEG